MALKRPEIAWEKTAYGAKITMHVPDVSKPKHLRIGSSTSHTRHTTARKGRVPDHAIRFRVPTDDTKTTTFWLRFTPYDEANRGKPLILKTVGFEDDKPGFIRASRTAGGASPRTIKDRVAQESQGDIYDRSKEHLGASDQGVILLRNTIKSPSMRSALAKIHSGFYANPRRTKKSPSMPAWPRSPRWADMFSSRAGGGA